MVHIMRKIKCKFTGSEDYQPEGIPRDRWFPVIGYEVRAREKDFQGKKERVEDIYYLVTNDKGKMVTIASFNCTTMIDESAEIEGGKLLSMLQNISIMGKVISEKLATFPDRKGGDGSKEQA
jgi:hypothetical protein